MRRLPLILLAIVVLAACARQGYPSGGPKDSTPPRALGTTPQNESRHFASDRFYIQFDEYVVLKNAEQNVIISPPMAHKPEFTTKGKGVLVKLKDTLQPGTTYLFQFKDAVADFTEGNLLPSFEYVFSTGETMDTMMMAGKVENARDGKPWKESVTVMAYREPDGDVVALADTVATSVQPDYVTRADKDGRFAFHYIPAGRYRLVALEDKNRNLRVDVDDAAAWMEQSVSAADSVDSASMSTLRLSAPDSRKQRVLKSEMPVRGRAEVVTAMPMRHPVVSGEGVETRLGEKGDTLTLWFLNPKCDSAVVVLSDEGLQDTLKLRYRAPRRGRPGSGQTTVPLMKSLCSGQLAWYDNLQLAFTNPIATVSDSLQIEVMYMKDSSVSHCRAMLDSSGLRATIQATLKADEDYTMRVPQGMFTDIYGTATDSMRFALKPKDFAILTLLVDNATGSQLVVELLDAKDTVVAHRTMTSSGEVRFDHIAAGEYRLRAVIDADGNGRWTEGEYRARRQPEEWRMFEKPLQLRERWEVEEKWRVEQ